MGPHGAPRACGRLDRSPRRRGRNAGSPCSPCCRADPDVDSYGRALTGPGNDALSIRSVEWLRDHHFGGRSTTSRTSGTPTTSRRRAARVSPALQAQISQGAARGAVAPGGTGPAPAPPPARGTAAPGPPPRSCRLRPRSRPGRRPAGGEGQWRPLGRPVNGLPAMYATYLRPDAVHTGLVAAVAWIDPKLVRGGAVRRRPRARRLRMGPPAADQPGRAAASCWPSSTPASRWTTPRAATTTPAASPGPMRTGAATLWITTDGHPHVGQWGRDVTTRPPTWSWPARTWI